MIWARNVATYRAETFPGLKRREIVGANCGRSCDQPGFSEAMTIWTSAFAREMVDCAELRGYRAQLVCDANMMVPYCISALFW